MSDDTPPTFRRFAKILIPDTQMDLRSASAVHRFLL